MGTLLDVLRALADGLLRVGGLGQEAHQAIHEVINEHDSEHQAEAAKQAQFSDADAAELARLQAKQAEAEQDKAEPAPVPSSPLLGPGAGPVTTAGGDPSGILGEFAQFLEWRQAQQAEAEGAGIDVPLFEKLADGTERSATLPMRQARGLLERWGWIPPEGADDGSSDAPEGGASGTARQFFQGLTGGKATGPQPASGQRAPRKAAG